jgi:hypothetical protein
MTTMTTTTTTTVMQANERDSSNDWTTVSSYDDDSTSSNAERRLVTLEGPPAVVPATPPAPAAPTVRSVKQIIVEDLRSDDEGTLVKALDDLWSVHLDPDRDDIQEMQDEFIDCGGHLAVSWIMEKHPDCKEIQRYGICVVGRAAWEDTKNIRMLFGKTKCIHAIYSTMQRFQQDTDILRTGFGALHCLTFEEEPNCKILVEELDALPFLVERMSSTVNGVTGILWACAILRNISKFPQLRPRVIRAKVVSALGHAMENHETNEIIQEYSKQALKLLFSEN